MKECGGSKCVCRTHGNDLVCCTHCDCFPGSASVTLENGKRLTMENLREGDKVQTGTKHLSICYIAT